MLNALKLLLENQLKCIPATADPQCCGTDCSIHTDDGHEVEGGEEEELMEVGRHHAQGQACVSKVNQLVDAENQEGEEHVEGKVASQPLCVVVEELYE